MALGRLIKQQLDEQGRSVAWLSRKTGISDNTLYAIIKRDSDNIPTDSLDKICNAFPIDPLELLSKAIEIAYREGDDKAYGTLSSKLMAVINYYVENFQKYVDDTKAQKEQYILTHDKDKSDDYEERISNYDTSIHLNEQFIEQIKGKYIEAQIMLRELEGLPIQGDHLTGTQAETIDVHDLTSEEIREMLTFKEFLKFKRLNNGK